MEKTTWNNAEPALRAELEGILANKSDAFESDFQDALVWWLLLLIASVSGAGAAIWELSTSDITFREYFGMLAANPLSFLPGVLYSPSYVGLPVALIVAAIVAFTIWRNVGRRGIALTSDAIVLLRGHKLFVYRLSEIASAQHRVIRTKKQTFSVIDAKLKNGKSKTFYCHARFAGLAMQKLGIPSASAASAA